MKSILLAAAALSVLAASRRPPSTMAALPGGFGGGFEDDDYDYAPRRSYRRDYDERDLRPAAPWALPPGPARFRVRDRPGQLRRRQGRAPELAVLLLHPGLRRKRGAIGFEAGRRRGSAPLPLQTLDVRPAAAELGLQGLEAWSRW